MKIIIMDIEVAPNRAMVGFMDHATGKITQFQHDESNAIASFINGHQLVGFNSNSYDDIILSLMVHGSKAKKIYKTSFDLIDGDGRPWDYSDIRCIRSIDLIEVAPGRAGLKLYGARLNTKQIQDLPYDPHAKHNKKMWNNVCKYNRIDLQVTKELYDFLQPQLKLRKTIGQQYGINVMSRSDAQIAEDIFRKELKLTRTQTTYKPNEILYKAPEGVTFRPELVQRIEDTVIKVGKSGSPLIPEWLKDEVITIGETRYNIGLGGLHSMEKSQAVTGHLGNVDVASMYPSLIITLGLYPQHLGKDFLRIYTNIRDRRMKAKHSGDKVTSDVLKIVLNGSYGKFGSIYSFLYAPDLMLQVTFTGQLYLLQLIQAFEDNGIKVVSANTDGIEYINTKEDLARKLVKEWEQQTGLDMEFGYYEGLFSRDVNSYIAKYDGYVKSKGFYGEPTLAKNPEYPIVTEAIRKFIQDGTRIKHTIANCQDVSKFCTSRTVRGGALWTDEVFPNTEEYDAYIKRVPFKQNKALEKRNETAQKAFISDDCYLGKVVRFYYSKKGAPMYYKESKNRVPKSEGCRPMMKLKKKIPKDLDYDKYITLAKKHIKELGL